MNAGEVDGLFELWATVSSAVELQFLEPGVLPGAAWLKEFIRS
jgi:hypothetical protein